MEKRDKGESAAEVGHSSAIGHSSEIGSSDAAGPASGLLARLNRPIDGASLAAFRFLFGWLMFTDMLTYLVKGWAKEYFADPLFLFTFYGFEWVRPLGATGMYLVFAALAVAALCISMGIFFRIAACVFTLGFSYIFLLEKALYLNHFYVVILLSFSLCLLPAGGLFSYDQKWGRVRRSDWVPAWSLVFIRALLVLIYVYAGIAKLNSDWLHGEPLTLWFHQARETPLIGGFIDQPTVALIASYAGLALDLIVAPLLLLRRTRIFALIALGSFHLLNATIFSIGIFPWMMLAADLLFLDPDYPRALPRLLPAIFEESDFARQSDPHAPLPHRLGPLGLSLLAGFFLLQVLIPLRHHLYPGNVAWTEEGHRFAWRMKLRDKRGSLEVRVQAGDFNHSLDLEYYLSRRQLHPLTCTPDMLLEFAHLLEKEILRTKTAMVSDGGRKRQLRVPSQWLSADQLKVYMNARCELNSRPAATLVDPNLDLTTLQDSFAPANWILPHPQLEPERFSRQKLQAP